MIEKPKEKVRVIDSLWTFLVATAILGPFALPLLWRNPRFKARTKVAGSIAVILLTVLCTWFLVKRVNDILGSLLAGALN